MRPIARLLSRLRSLALEATEFHQLPEDARVGMWRLNSQKFNRLYAEARADHVVLDLGCGPPLKQAPLRAELGSHRYLGVDFYISSKPTVVAASDRLPFSGNSVAVARCYSLLEHVYDPRATIHDVFRVLHPGGCLFVQVPFILEFHGHPSDYYRFSHIALQRLLEAGGFRVVGLSRHSTGLKTPPEEASQVLDRLVLRSCPHTLPF